MAKDKDAMMKKEKEDADSTVDRILEEDLKRYTSLYGSSRVMNSPVAAATRAQSRIIDWLYQKVKQGLITPERKIAVRNMLVSYFMAWDIPVVKGLIEQEIKEFVRPYLERSIDELLDSVK